MDTLEICYMSAGDLSKLVKNKEVSPVEIIDSDQDRGHRAGAELVHHAFG